MRSDPVAFATANQSAEKRPRFVISIEYDVESIYLSSHAGISGIPGIHIDNVLQRPTAISQKIIPDEGRSEIGSFAFSLVDLDSAFTEELREKLGDGKGLRGKTVRFYVGYESRYDYEGGGFGTWGDTFGYGEGSTFRAVFRDFQLFQTQIVTEASYHNGVYQVRCADITREQRKDIFEPKTTTLRDTISATDTTVPVYTTSGFHPVWHTASFSDAPSTKVGYVKVDKEWIRYTGLTADSFTGCTRGVLNTRAVEHTVDAGADADRRPKVEEGIYLEMPAVKIAYAILTGRIYGTSPLQTLPEHWHLGIDPDLITLDDFTGIGDDLWDLTNDSNGFVARFQGLTKTDGKKFLETELYMLLGCYSPVYSDGTIGLKRMNQVLADSAYVVELSANNIISHGELRHEYSRLHNRLQIDWNWNGERFTRSTLFVDAASVSAHGPAPIKRLQFKGLHGARHTEAVLRKRMDALRDRYSSPPQTTTIDVLPSLNWLEVGDVIRDRMRNVRDFAGSTANIDRSFEIQRRTLDYATGHVSLELFGSTARASTEAPNTAETALPDAFYTSEGTDLTTVCTISVVGDVGVIQPGTYNLTGAADMNDSAAIYYYDGELELANGATLTINDNVQIRARGFFTINGEIDGVGRGQAGVASTSQWNVANPGLPGFIGNSRGMDGIYGDILDGLAAAFSYYLTVPAAMTVGANASFPFVELSVSGNSIAGIPADLRGTSGGAGGNLGNAVNKSAFAQGTITAAGGTGGDSGAGLCIISRGSAFGASATINLSGNDSTATPLITGDSYAGAGGSGGPGALLILLDGSSQQLPDVGGKFVAMCGEVPVSGNPMPVREGFIQILQLQHGWFPPVAGYSDPSMISGVDLSNVAYRIQYIPQEEDAQEDQPNKPPSPTSLSVSSGIGQVTVRVEVDDLLEGDQIEYYASIDNNRSNAVRQAFGPFTEFVHSLATGETRYYWVRVRRPQEGVDAFSDWIPSGETDGATGNSSRSGTGDLDEDSASEVVVSQPADNSVSFPLYSSGSSFRDTRNIASVSWLNDTGETMEVTMLYSALVALVGTSPSAAIAHWIYGQYNIGAGDINDGSDSLKLISVSPEYDTRSGSLVVDVANGQTITSRIVVSMTGPSGSYDPQDVAFKGVSISLHVRKR